MSNIRDRSKKFWAVDEEMGRYVSYAPPLEPASTSQNKKNQKKKREKNSWRNGGCGAVNPKCQGRFLKVTQLSGRLGRGRKIEEIPFFRDHVSSNPAEGNNKRSFKLSPAAATKIFGSSMIPQSPNKIVKASERACLAPVAVRKSDPLDLAPLSLIQYSIPRQDSADCLAPQQHPQTVISVAEPLSTPAVVSSPILQQQPEQPVSVQSVSDFRLIKSVINREHQLLERLLRDLPVDIVNAQDSESRTALHHAVLHRDKRAARQLVECDKVDCNLQDSDGNTALIIAIRDTGNSEITQILLAFPGKNNIYLVNKLDQSAISIARELGNNVLVTQLLSSARQPEAFEKTSVQIEVEAVANGSVMQDMSSIWDPEKFVPIHRRSSDDSVGSVSYSIATMVK